MNAKSSSSASAPRRGPVRQLPLLATAVILVVLFGTASFCYDGFCSPRVAVNLLADNAFLGIAALGMTLVIFSGGIDLSVGSIIGFTSIFTATLVTGKGVHPLWAWSGAIALMDAQGASAPPCTVTAGYTITLKRPTPTSGPVRLRARATEIAGDRAVVEGTLEAGGKITATCRGVFVAVREGHPAYHRW